MVAKPTHGPKENNAGARVFSQENVSVVALNYSGGGVTGAKNRIIWQAPKNKRAKITYVGVNNNVAMYHAAAEADTWTMVIQNKSTSGALSLNTPSLSNQTLAASGFKSIPTNGGNSTYDKGAVMELQLGVSGAPQTMDDVTVVIHWSPISD